MGGRVIDIHEKNKWEYCLAQVFNLCKKFVFVLLHVIFLSGRGGAFPGQSNEVCVKHSDSL